MEKLVFGVRVVFNMPDGKFNEIKFYGDSYEEVHEILRNHCTFYKFVQKSSDVDK